MSVPSPKDLSDDSRWFVDHVHCHAPKLRSYIRSSFPTIGDVDDVVQESLLRVWKARAARRIVSTRAFLFTIARNLALDTLRRSRPSLAADVEDIDDLHACEAVKESARLLEQREKIELVAAAIDALPERCREVIVLRKLHGLSQREVAERLNLSEKTVEAHVARGTRRCEAYLAARGFRSSR